MTDKQAVWFDALKTIGQMKVLVQVLGLTPQEESMFWKELLELLRAQTSPMEVEENDSLFTFITSTADLKDKEIGEKLYSELYSTLNKMIEDEEDDSFWNESVYELIEFFINELKNKDDKVVENLDGGLVVTIEDLKKSDAGNNFPEYRNEETEWVHPWYNIDGDSYDDVRKHDEVLEILKKYAKLQYTRRPDNNDTEESEFFDKWIRLLMPQYGRRVEVEDLNRNFWVITQTIAAISAYLFSEDSPLPKMLEGLLRETSEIWENIAYLWTGLAAISQNIQGGVQTIVLPLQTRYNEHGRQYDNFDVDLKSYANFDPSKDWYAYDKDDKGYVKIARGDNFKDEVIKRIEYLAEQYSDRNLCIIPYIRLENYKHNYYSGEWYPGIYMYDQLKKTWTTKMIKEAPETIPIGGESLVYQIQSPEDLFKRYCYIETGLTEAELNEEKRQFEFYINDTLANPYSARFAKKNDKICVFLDFGNNTLDEGDTVSLKTFVGDDVEKVVIQYKNPPWHGETTPDQLVDIDGSYKAIMSDASSWCYDLSGGYLYYYKDPSVWANFSKIWQYPIHIKEEDLPDWVENTEGDLANQNGWILLQWLNHDYDAYMCQSYGALKNNKYWKDRYTVKIEVRNGSTDEKWYDLLKDRGNIGNIIINVHHLEEGETGRPAAFIILLNGGSTDFTRSRGMSVSLQYKDPNAHDTSIAGDYYNACPAEYRITIYNAPNYTPPGEPKVYSTKVAPVNYFHIPNKNYKNWKEEEGKYARHFYLGEEELTTEQYSITTMNWLKQICVQQETEPIYIWTNMPINDPVRLFTETINGEVIFEERELVISPHYEEIYEDSVDGSVVKRFTDKIFAAKQDDNGRILWAYPYDSISSVESDGRITLYGSLRTVPFVDCVFEDNEFKINNVELMISDPASEVIGQGKRILGEYNSVEIEEKNDTLYFQYTPAEIPEPVDVNPLQLYSSKASVVNEGYYMGEVASWKGKTAEVVESENLFNDVAYVLKVGNYLPSSGDFTMASVRSNGFRYTSMRGNVTKKGTGTTTDTYYYKFRWDTYNAHNDGTADELVINDNSICYETAPERKKSTYPTRKQIFYDGLIAVKKFLEVNDLFKEPCYIITAIGLTPWKGTGRTGTDIYWDSAFIPAIYYYIPSPETISGHPEGTPGYNIENYKAAYNDESLNPVNLSIDGIETIEGWDGKGTIRIDGKEVGKIVLCAPIERYEGYFQSYKCAPATYYPESGSHWRQFYVTNHSTGNTCVSKTFNGGPNEPDGSISYTATFSPIFEGTVEYFDVERHMVSEPRVTLRFSKQSKCAEAKVQIDTVKGYQQIEDGKIVNTYTINTDTYEDKENKAYLVRNTGFQQRLTDSHQVDTEKNDIYNLISKLGNEHFTGPSVFAGGTPLVWSDPPKYCYYKNDITT